MSNEYNHADAIEASNQASPTPAANRLRRLAVKSLRIIGFGYLAVLVTLVVMETRLVYPGAFMEPGVIRTSTQIQTVRYTTDSGAEARGRLLHRDTAKPIVLYFHGNGSQAAWLDSWLTRLADQFDANVMAAEFRGYGDEAQEPDEASVLADCFAARRFLMETYNVAANRIILYGRSLGGGCAAAVAADGGAQALVLDRTFDRLVDVAAGKYPFIPVRLLMRNRYDSIGRLESYHGPMIQLHGTSDRLIPIAHGRRLFDSAPSEQKHWIEVPGLGHNETLPSHLLAEVALRVQKSVALSTTQP
jgi:fermentation-respiration switch protein FrsA (DUF1100 family)